LYETNIIALFRFKGKEKWSQPVNSLKRVTPYIREKYLKPPNSRRKAKK